MMSAFLPRLSKSQEDSRTSVLTAFSQPGLKKKCNLQSIHNPASTKKASDPTFFSPHILFPLFLSALLFFKCLIV